jgi:membrane-bound lytic murein transglycosylase MltF
LLTACDRSPDTASKTAPDIAKTPVAGSATTPDTAEDFSEGILNRLFTGDFDEMRKRRLVRVLVVFSKTNYFIDRGVQMGLTYDAMRMFEEDINRKLKTGLLKIHVAFIPVARDELIPRLLEGRGDIAAANLTITPEREQHVDFSTPAYRDITEIVVTGPGSIPLESASDLSGREVFVRESSSYFSSLQALNTDLENAGKAPVNIRPAPETLEDEDLLEMVNAGIVNTTIVDNHVAGFWKQVFPNITLHPQAAVRTGGRIAWMFRKNSPLLKAEVDAFIAKYPPGSLTFNMLRNKYLKSTKFVKNSTSEAEMKKFRELVETFRKYGTQYEFDHLLAMAQGYQESQLDQSARGPTGAIGIMQVMPATAAELNVGDITQPEANIHAGVKYVRNLYDQYYKDEPMTQLDKALFTFASFNAGPARIRGLRKEAAERGLDPNRWFNQVELVAADKIGPETVTYVSNIYKYYVAYKLVAETGQARARAREQLGETD